jgi:hypothetical protein
VIGRDTQMVGILSLGDIARGVSHARSGEVMDKLLA